MLIRNLLEKLFKLNENLGIEYDSWKIIKRFSKELGVEPELYLRAYKTFSFVELSKKVEKTPSEYENWLLMLKRDYNCEITNSLLGITDEVKKLTKEQIEYSLQFEDLTLIVA